MNKSNINRFPPEIAKQHIPGVVVKILNGAAIAYNYENKKDVVEVRFDNVSEYLHVSDFSNAKAIADRIYKTWIVTKKIETSYQTLGNTILIWKLAYIAACDIYDKKFAGKRRVIFIKGDDSGCGYWRMVLPSYHLDPSKYIMDVSVVEVVYDCLMEYDVIVVQRTLSWPAYYVIEKLKAAGKRIVYDIDDNMFELPEHHSARRVVGADELAAAAAIMGIADCVTVTTQILKETICKFTGVPESKVAVIPNSIDIANYPARVPKNDTIFRIVWGGSSTHEVDFHECLGAIDELFEKYPKKSMRLLLMGYCPRCVQQYMSRDHWKDRVEFVKFNDIETYFSMVSKVNANIGIVPLADDAFNRNKSCIKWMEYTLAGVPVIASDVPPYSNTIESCSFMASNQSEWFERLEFCLNNPDDLAWGQMVAASRELILKDYDIAKNVKLWSKVLD